MFIFGKSFKTPLHMLFINPRITADLFDNEIILANLDTGLYYTLSGCVIEALNHLPTTSLQDLSAILIEKYGTPFQEKINQDVEQIISELKKEEIVLDQEKYSTKEYNFDFKLPEEYQCSVFNKYADMQDLLVLDPIHDVDEDGWAVQESTQSSDSAE